MAASPINGGVVVTREIIGVRWCQIQCAVPVVTESGCMSSEIIGVRWCRIQCAVPVVTESGCGSDGDGIGVRFRW
ncbi:hypothetical protein Hanom_Chr01g00028131 [Helianthus anomalus]